MSKKDKKQSMGLKSANLITSLFFGFFLILLLGSFMFSGCASMKQPEGGPKDSIPPKILKESPKNFSVNFNSKKIVIEFDEYFKLQDQAKEFNLSPEMAKPPILKVDKKSLVIEFQDTLEKNVTYTLNFGQSIQDVNESNKLKNFSYVFATGPKLDSLSISGTVKDALTLEKSKKESMVFLVPVSRDTVLGKKRPSIYVNTDSSGRFSLKNLREDTYHLYALEDESGDKIYQQNIDKIAFFSGEIRLTKDTSGIELQLFKEYPDKFIVTSRQINNDGSIGLIFNKPLKDLMVSVAEPSKLDQNKQILYSKGRDTVKLWLEDMNFDSVKLNVKDKDSLLQVVKLTKSAKATYKREMIIGDNIASGSLALGRNYSVQTNFPIDNINSSLIEILEDSIKRDDFNVVKNESDFLKFEIQYPFKAKKNYNINFLPGAITGKYGSKNTKYSATFKQASVDDYGTLTVKYKVMDSSAKFDYIVELLTVEDYKLVTRSVIKKDTTLLYKNFPAQKYVLRVIEDANKNGEWDSGDVFKRIQPERIWLAPKQMYLRANWETEETVEIPLFDRLNKKTESSVLMDVSPAKMSQDSTTNVKPTNQLKNGQR